MRIVRAVIGGVAALAVSWVIGGPLGAALNAPGFLMLEGARRLGALRGLQEPSLEKWIWLASILSALVWGFVVYLALSLRGRREKRAGRKEQRVETSGP
jgi:hypothetical protein